MGRIIPRPLGARVTPKQSVLVGDSGYQLAEKSFDFSSEADEDLLSDVLFTTTQGLPIELNATDQPTKFEIVNGSGLEFSHEEEPGNLTWMKIQFSDIWADFDPYVDRVGFQTLWKDILPDPIWGGVNSYQRMYIGCNARDDGAGIGNYILIGRTGRNQAPWNGSDQSMIEYDDGAVFNTPVKFTGGSGDMTGLDAFTLSHELVGPGAHRAYWEDSADFTAEPGSGNDIPSSAFNQYTSGNHGTTRGGSFNAGEHEYWIGFHGFTGAPLSGTLVGGKFWRRPY